MRRIGLLLLCAAAGFAACGGRDAGAGAGGEPRAPRRVQLVAAGTAELPRKVAVSGVLAAQEELVLGLEVAGRLATLDVDVGDVVAAGAVVAALAPREFELDVARADAALLAAVARLGLRTADQVEGLDAEQVPAVREAKALVVEATLQRDRVASLVQERMQSTADLDTAAAALVVAESRLQRARDEVQTWLAEARLQRVACQQAEKRLADSRVLAPWPGRIAARHAAVGQVLAAGAPVVTLLRVDPLRLRLRVPDRLAVDVAIGQTVEFTVDGAEDRLRTGRIVRAGPAIDRGDRTRLVEAEVGNADGALLPGAFCRAQIVTAPALPAVVVPRSAVVSFAGVDRVFLVQADAVDPKAPSRAKGRIVSLGRTTGQMVEVVAGLAAGDRVVRDAAGLSPESPVVVE